MMALRASPISALDAVVDRIDARTNISITDCSLLPRFGVKGPAATGWLATQGIQTPAVFNTWSPMQDGQFVARLGRQEYLVEGEIALRLKAAVRQLPTDVYPVPRDDAAMILIGQRLPNLLRQTCNVNFAALDLNHKPVVLTTMVGVAVLVLPAVQAGLPCYRLWCDYSYGDYLWRTLLDIMIELGGGVLPFSNLPPESALYPRRV